MNFPFLLEVKDILSIIVHGQVTTKNMNRGMIKLFKIIDIIGLKEMKNITIINVKMFYMIINVAWVGDKMRLLNIFKNNKMNF